MSMNQLVHKVAHLPHRKAKHDPDSADGSKVLRQKSGGQPAAGDDLKSLPIAEVEKRLGSSPDGLSEAEAAQRLVQYGSNEIEEKKANPLLSCCLFLGAHSVMIEAAVILLRPPQALARLLHHPRPPAATRIVGLRGALAARLSTPSRPAGGQGQGEA